MKFRIYSTIAMLTGSLINQTSTVSGVAINIYGPSLDAAEDSIGNYQSILAEVEHKSDGEIDVEDDDEIEALDELERKEARKAKKIKKKAEKLRLKAEKKAEKI